VHPARLVPRVLLVWLVLKVRLVSEARPDLPARPVRLVLLVWLVLKVRLVSEARPDLPVPRAQLVPRARPALRVSEARPALPALPAQLAHKVRLARRSLWGLPVRRLPRKGPCFTTPRRGCWSSSTVRPGAR
jgi:hypothetical protein